MTGNTVVSTCCGIGWKFEGCLACPGKLSELHKLCSTVINFGLYKTLVLCVI